MPRADDELSREDRKRRRAQVGSVCAHGSSMGAHMSVPIRMSGASAVPNEWLAGTNAHSVGPSLPVFFMRACRVTDVLPTCMLPNPAAEAGREEAPGCQGRGACSAGRFPGRHGSAGESKISCSGGGGTQAGEGGKEGAAGQRHEPQGRVHKKHEGVLQDTAACRWHGSAGRRGSPCPSSCPPQALTPVLSSSGLPCV